MDFTPQSPVPDLSALPAGIVAFEARSGRVTQYNPAANRLFGPELETRLTAGHPVYDAIVPALAGESICGEEVRFRSVKGVDCWVSICAGPVLDAEGHVVSAVASFHDVTVQRQREENRSSYLEERDEQLRMVADNAPALLSYIDRDQIYRRVNRKYLAWTGLQASEIEGRTLREIIGEPHYTNAQPQIARVLAGEPVFYESQMRFSDGELHDIAVEYTPDADEAGHVRGFIALVQDITERRRNDLEREQMFRKLSGVLASIAEGLVVADPAGNILDINPAAQKILGVGAGRRVAQLQHLAQGLEFRTLDGDLVPPADWPLSRVLRGESFSDAEYRLIRTETPVDCIASCNGVAVSDNQGIQQLAILTLRDTTERHKSEDALRRASQRLRSHLENTPLGLVDFDADYRIVRWSRRAQEIFGWSSTEVLGKRPDEFRWVHEDEVSEIGPLMRDLQAGRTQFFVKPIRNYRKDGSVVHCQWYSSGLSGKDGHLESILSLALDVTDRVRALEELRLAEERFRLALAGSNVIVFNQDSDLRYVWVHHPSDTFNVAALLGKSDLELDFFGEDAEELASFKRRVIESGIPARQELRVRSAAGDRHYDIRVVPTRDAAGQIGGITGTAVDITSRKEMENLLRESNDALRLANSELEEFAFVAAHDLQEPLRTVSVYSQLLLRRYPPDAGDEVDRYGRYVKEGVNRIETLIRDLLSYSQVVRDGDEVAQSVDAGAALSQAIAMIQQQVDEAGAEIEFDPLPVVLADQAHLALVFQNLVSNALKYRREGVPPRVRVTVVRDGGEWVFEFRDNGIGFDPRYRERIFGLFKRLHRNEYPGTGLGLAICKRIVERFGGRIWADSELGQGSSFFVALPAP